MEKSYGISNVRVIRTGVDLDEFEYAPPKDRPHVVFTGSMDWLANIDGIEFFMRDVWPLIARSVENASMTVVGRDPPRDLVEEVAREGLPWRVTGFVDDVRPFVREASCFVIPLRVGGGTRLKVFEAMAMGCPVVSTRLGVEGLGLVAGQHYLEADTPCEFAASVMRLLEDGQLRLRLSREARAFVADNHSFRSAAADFERICLDTLEQ